MRPRIAAVGARAWVTGRRNVELPAGLDPRTPVRITAVHDLPRIMVVTDDGREFRLDYRQYDTGADYCGPAGNWLPEEHRKVKAALREELARHIAHGPPQTASARAIWKEYRDTLQWVIERSE